MAESIIDLEKYRVKQEEELRRIRIENQAVRQENLKIPKTMDEITRHELDAKLELVESRTDARLARMEVVVERVAQDVKDITSASSNFKWWAIGTGIAVVIGLYAANVSLLQGFIASFESGKSTGAAQQQKETPPQVQKQIPPPK